MQCVSSHMQKRLYYREGIGTHMEIMCLIVLCKDPDKDLKLCEDVCVTFLRSS